MQNTVLKKTKTTVSILHHLLSGTQQWEHHALGIVFHWEDWEADSYREILEEKQLRAAKDFRLKV